MSNEIEIKLQVPAESLAALQRELARGHCTVTRLAATYFDTHDAALARCGLVLRLRREGRRWVQALKAPGDGLLERVEHEVDRGAGRAMPVLDLAAHEDHAAGRALRRALERAPQPPAPVFSVNVRRQQREVRIGTARIELAFDEGVITAGRSKQPVCELELELKAGPVEALAALAQRWAERHGLWLDTRSKSERGWLLARGVAASPATGYAAPRVPRRAVPDAALRAMVRSALAQWLPNASALAAGTGDATHVHQARVGLRRLLAVLREYGAWSEAVDADWRERVAFVFDQLGGTRDRDVLEAELLPVLHAAGAPGLKLPEAEQVRRSPQAACRSRDATRCAIELLAFAHGESAPDAPQAPGVQRAPDAPHADMSVQAAERLTRLHRQARRAGRTFATLPDEERHRARRRVKRLRYAAEALASCWPRAAWAAYLARLKTAQDALGRFQDLCMAQALFAAPAPDDALAWFARGWLAARREPLIAEAGAALAAIGKAPSFLR
jgi:triphosphatase